MAGLSGTILITGGAGTLGHAIARAASAQGWGCSLTIYSRSELRQAQMRARFPTLRYVLGDVADYERLQATVAGHDTIIHAAASKRIPECEQQPAQCITTNIVGSLNVARAAQVHQTRLVIGISTDKACEAITTYGASKLLLESIWRAQPSDGPRFVAVRYGNVVASNGSVIPLWRQQAREGKPLTITHPDMTRFWMAPSDAVNLIVQAAYEAPGIVLVPKAGALSVLEMARMVCPGSEVQVMGVRSTEKLTEDLVHPLEIASESLTHFRIGIGEAGRSYRSDTARRLTPTEFLSMLEEADTYA